MLPPVTGHNEPIEASTEDSTPFSHGSNVLSFQELSVKFGRGPYWSKPCDHNTLVYDYEIKVSRSDFLGDDKWHQYLPLCNEFYWVCPWGLIQPNEVGEGAGLMWLTNTGSRVIRKVKAVYRDVEIPENVWRYVLMCRSKIVPPTQINAPDMGRAYWERWLEKRWIDHDFGQRVGRAIREQVDKEILEVRRENKRLQERMEGYDQVKRTLEEAGFDLEKGTMLLKLDVKERLRKLREVVPGGFKFDLKNIRDHADQILTRLQEVEEGAGE